MNTIVKGDALMLFDANGESIALATSHTLSISGDVAQINCKDGGIWTGGSVNQLNWSIDTDNLYSTVEFDRLFTMMTARTPVDVYFGLKVQTGTGDVDTDGVTPTSGATQKVWTKGTGSYKGKAVISSLNVNAPSGDNATFTASFTGVGALVKETETSEESHDTNL